MKAQSHLRIVYLGIISLFFCLSSIQLINAQNRVRIKADYINISGSEKYLDIATSARVDKKNIEVGNIELTVVNEVEDDEIDIGVTKTDMHGKSRFVIKDFSSLQADSTNTYHLKVNFKGNDDYKKASRSLSFKNAEIETKLVTRDSINYISATLMESPTNNPISDESLVVQIQRLFRALQIGEEFNYTDENGTILVPIEEGIPGVDGILTLEVVLEDSDDYGTVKGIMDVPLGIPIVDESTFDERTMWSPRNKTPLFLLIFPNLVIFGMWGYIIYLIINLFKISKSKN